MASAFISYGQPDVEFAAKINEGLRSAGIKTFFFRDAVEVGRRLHHIIRDNIESSDRVVLLCSKASLNRPGVENEIEETLSREAYLGGQTILLPIAIDDYVFTDWKPREAGFAIAIQRRLIADFRGSFEDIQKFDIQIAKVVASVQSDYPVIHLDYSNHVNVLDEKGKLSISIVRKSLMVNKGILEKYTFNDLDASGNIASLSSPSGEVMARTVGGAKTAEIKFARPFKTGELVQLELRMELTNCHTQNHEDLRTRLTSPYRSVSLRASLPVSRPAKTIYAYKNSAERQSNLRYTIYEPDKSFFGVEINDPSVGSYYSLEWDW